MQKTWQPKFLVSFVAYATAQSKLHAPHPSRLATNFSAPKNHRIGVGRLPAREKFLANKLQFQVLQVIKCVIDLLPWQPTQTCTRKWSECVILSFLPRRSSNGRAMDRHKKWLNYSDGKKTFFVFLFSSVGIAIRNWKRRWRGIWTWVRCALMLSTMIRHRTGYFSEFGILNCTHNETDALSAPAINLHQFIMNGRRSRTNADRHTAKGSRIDESPK